MNKKIILNCLPPTSLNMPAIGCEILKSYIETNSMVDVSIVYWNHLFQEIYFDVETKTNLFQPQNDLQTILPFLSLLAEDRMDDIVRERIIFKMQEVAPEHRTIDADYYRHKYYRQIKQIKDIFRQQLPELLTEDVFAFGISAKFDAWLPGIILAHEVKKIRPDVKIILGGVEEAEATKAIFNFFGDFDFAIWGEGEIPLGLLINRLVSRKDEFTNIPRLLHRQTNIDEVVRNSAILDTKESYFDLKDYPQLTFADYFNYAANFDRTKIQLPLEISRGCRWNKCNFCALNWGYTYRTQDYLRVVDQIKQHYLRNKVTKYFFVDNDIIGKDMQVLEGFLDALIRLSVELNVDFDFHADILHLRFHKGLLKKLSLAGFKSVQIGYEGVSDSMLNKLNKSTTFAENLLFIKYAQKYDIEVTITGLIIGIPDEVEEDVYESARNLHFLRFMLGEPKGMLQHRFAELMLFYETNFWKMLPEAEREKFDCHPMNDYLPSNLLSDTYVRYSLLGQSRTPPMYDKWGAFKKISDHYQNTNYRYCLIQQGEVVNYLEYKGDIKVASFIFDQPEYWEVLTLANDRIVSFAEIFTSMKKKYNSFSEEKLNEIINQLNGSHLLYSSTNRNKNITIIDTKRL